MPRAYSVSSSTVAGQSAGFICNALPIAVNSAYSDSRAAPSSGATNISYEATIDTNHVVATQS